MARNYKILIFSFIFLNIYSLIQVIEFKFGIPAIVKYILSVFVICVIIYNSSLHSSKPRPGGLFYPIIVFFISWSVILLISACLKFNSMFYLQRVFGQAFFFIPYFIPLFILYSEFNLQFFSTYFYYCSILIIPALIILLYILLLRISVDTWMEQTLTIGIFDIGSSFLLLSSHFSKKKYTTSIVTGYFLLMIVLWSFYGRRGMLIETILLLVFMILIRLRSSLLRIADRVKIYYSVLLIILGILVFGYIFNSSYVFQRGFSKQAFEESRGMVFEDFFSDFKSNSDWLFGRGIDAKILRTIDEEHGASNFLENGFLTILLKGGLLYLVPFTLIFLRAVYLGFFKSKNDLVKGLASIVLIHLILMLSFNVPEYSTRYILTWICISACFNPELRQYTDTEIVEALNFKFSSNIIQQ